MNIVNIDEFMIGDTKDFKFGLITREVYRALKNLFVIDDTSCGWTSAQVDQQTLENLLNGKLSLLDIDFS